MLGRCGNLRVGRLLLYLILAGPRSARDWWPLFLYNTAPHGVSDSESTVDRLPRRRKRPGALIITRASENWAALHLAENHVEAALALRALVSADSALRKAGWSPPRGGLIVVCPDDLFEASAHWPQSAHMGGYTKPSLGVVVPLRSCAARDFTRMVAHELVHLGGPVDGGCLAPAWLEEGVAELVSFRAYPGAPRWPPDHGRQALRDFDTAAWANSANPYLTSEPYTRGWAACGALADIHGLAAVRRLLHLARQYGLSSEVYEAAFGLSTAEVEQQLRQTGDRAGDAAIAPCV